MNTLAALEEVSIKRSEMEQMLEFSRLMYRLKHHEKYPQSLQHKLPSTAGVMPNSDSMLMGFDFHLTDDGPRLIEINNNAGGLYIGQQNWLPQPCIPELANSLSSRLIQMFPTDWKHIAIMDEAIESQYMYPEMQAYQALLNEAGHQVYLASPEDILRKSDGLYIKDQRLDGIYNRHTDFYLESEALSDVRWAVMQGLLALNPHPRSYALLGDKARMVDWWHPGLLDECLGLDEVDMVRTVVPEIHLLSECDLGLLWKSRKQWVFKPAARHGGKGVVLGKAMSRKRFESLDLATTVVQAYVPASELTHNDVKYKFDVRLFMHGEQLIALAGRLWRGQLTNFREAGSGWVSLKIVD
ncbi:MAG: hypothetical protein R8K49_00405 [Mariprofundaceae bacterium]